MRKQYLASFTVLCSLLSVPAMAAETAPQVYTPQTYEAGAYPVPEQATPSKVQGDYSNVNDKKGDFSAYNLPEGAVKQQTMGKIIDRIYVPPGAPVSGGIYTSVDQAPAQPQPAPQAAPAPQPAAVPAATSPVQAPRPPVAAPAANTNYQDELNVPNVDTPPQIPSPGLPNAPRAEKLNDGLPAPIPQVGASGVPQAPPGSTPIPPSDLKPAPTFVPPAGTAVPAPVEDRSDAGAPLGYPMSEMPQAAQAELEQNNAQAQLNSFVRAHTDKKSPYNLNN